MTKHKAREGYDVIIIGGGHNGLVCGTYLAKAGLRVCVMERRYIVGGATVTEELWPGYQVSVASFYMGLMQPKIIRELELDKHGLSVVPTPPLFQPFPDGRYLIFHDDISQTCAHIAKFSTRDAQRYPEYRAHVAKLAGVLRQLLWETPRDPSNGRLSDAIGVGQLLWRLRKERRSFHHIGDLLTLSALDFLDRWFESDQIKASLGFYATAGGSHKSLRTPGTALLLVRQAIRDPAVNVMAAGFVRGGMGGVATAISRAGAHYGMEVRTSADVAKVLVRGGRTVGVVLTSGEEVAAKAVISNANIQTTFMRLIEHDLLPSEMLRDVQNYRTKASGYKINLAVESPPIYSSFDPEKAGFAYPAQVKIAPSVDYLEAAYDAAKYGGIAQQPYVNINVPSIVDDTVAPAGKHILSIWAGHAAYDLKDRDWDDQARDELLTAVLDTLSVYAPEFKDRILHKQILSPRDLNEIFDLPGGHVHHGDITIDQMFFRRPVAGCADYRTPITGLYLCGSSSHPGGGVTGVPGHNAAREFLKDWKELRKTI